MTDPGFARRIRPYVLTGGRTRSTVDVELETQVRAAEAGDEGEGLGPEQRRILALCQVPCAVAEVSARTGLHLQVTKILVGDLVAEGRLTAGDRKAQSDRPDLGLLERVLDGLQAL